MPRTGRLKIGEVEYQIDDDGNADEIEPARAESKRRIRKRDLRRLRGNKRSKLEQVERDLQRCQNMKDALDQEIADLGTLINNAADDPDPPAPPTKKAATKKAAR